jgi:hypothetical protein
VVLFCNIIDDFIREKFHPFVEFFGIIGYLIAHNIQEAHEVNKLISLNNIVFADHRLLFNSYVDEEVFFFEYFNNKESVKVEPFSLDLTSEPIASCSCIFNSKVTICQIDDKSQDVLHLVVRTLIYPRDKLGIESNWPLAFLKQIE